VHVAWVTAFIDRPSSTYAASEAFWCAANAAALSPRRGGHGEFATLLPSDGDAFVRMQRTLDGSAGSHLDLHVGDVRAGADRAVTLGAVVEAADDGIAIMRSPSGLPFCIVRHHGESVRPRPAAIAGGGRTLLDQVCIDAAPESFEEERTFWSAVTGWRVLGARRPEFTALRRPDGMPIRLLLQRRGYDAVGAPTTCHVDLACDDVVAAEARHVGLGATSVARHRYWTVMADPSGVVYCLTRRSPDTGMLPPE
jgi:hypothetical protein